MKKMNEVSIIFSSEEYDTLKSLPISGGVIRKETDASGLTTGKINVREWEDAFIVSFRSEGARDHWYTEICYAFQSCGFWRSIGWQHWEEIEKSTKGLPSYNEEDFNKAEAEYKIEMAELKRIGQAAYIAKLDREWRAGWGVEDNVERQAVLL